MEHPDPSSVGADVGNRSGQFSVAIIGVGSRIAERIPGGDEEPIVVTGVAKHVAVRHLVPHYEAQRIVPIGDRIAGRIQHDGWPELASSSSNDPAAHRDGKPDIEHVICTGWASLRDLPPKPRCIVTGAGYAGIFQLALQLLRIIAESRAYVVIAP